MSSLGEPTLKKIVKPVLVSTYLLNGSDDELTCSKTSSSSSLKLSLQETRVEKDEVVTRPKPGLPLPASRCKQLSDLDLKKNQFGSKYRTPKI